MSKSLNMKSGPLCAAYSKSRFACFAMRLATGTDINPRSTCNVRNVARLLGRFSSCSRLRAARCLIPPLGGILQVSLGTLRLNRKLLPPHRTLQHMYVSHVGMTCDLTCSLCRAWRMHHLCTCSPHICTATIALFVFNTSAHVKNM